MTKTQAHAILDRIKRKDRHPVSLAETNQALERTGDLCRASGESLCADGYELSDYRPRQTHEQISNVGFSYSKYLDYSKTEGVTQ
jgi:hypothetical protein